MQKYDRISRITRGTLLIAGTAIGAGMLGIPLTTADTGFLPGLLITCIVWLFMYCTGLFFLEVTSWLPEGSNILSISRHFLGSWGTWLAGGMFAFLYYCLMIAYFAAGAPLLGHVLTSLGISPSSWVNLLLFGVIFGTVVAISPRSIDRANIILTIAMGASWCILIGSGGSEIVSDRLKLVRWSKMPLAMSILFSAFGFHNIIPSLYTYLQRDIKAIRKAIFWGSFLPLIVYIIWQWIIIGTIPQNDIISARQFGIPVTEMFQVATGTSYLVSIGRFFAFFAIVTSTLGVSFSLVDFLGDGFGIIQRRGWKRLLLTFLAFSLPFIFSALNPAIFANALSIAGGIGESFLNGLLPIGLFWIGKYIRRYETDLKWFSNRCILSILLLYVFFVIGLELCHLVT